MEFLIRHIVQQHPHNIVLHGDMTLKEVVRELQKDYKVTSGGDTFAVRLDKKPESKSLADTILIIAVSKEDLLSI